MQWHRGQWDSGDFWGGNFRGGDFRGGDFRGEKLTIRPLCIYGLEWLVIITAKQMQIGCERHAHEEWFAFTDERIARMESRAAGFWSIYRVALLELCATQAAKADQQGVKL